jgi:hypothetical protein
MLQHEWGGVSEVAGERDVCSHSMCIFLKRSVKCCEFFFQSCKPLLVELPAFFPSDIRDQACQVRYDFFLSQFGHLTSSSLAVMTLPHTTHRSRVSSASLSFNNVTGAGCKHTSWLAHGDWYSLNRLVLRIMIVTDSTMNMNRRDIPLGRLTP